jgi:integrase/recombinase XerD
MSLQQSSSEIINQFCKWLESSGKSYNTIKTYLRELQRYQTWLSQSHINIQDISQKDVQRYITYLENQGKSPNTNDKILGAIRTFAKFIKKPEIIVDIKIIPVPKDEEVEILTQLECQQLLNAVKADGHKRNIAIVYTLLHTGIRVSELCALNKADIDFNQNLLIVRSTQEVQRTIPLSDEAKSHLQNYLDSEPIGEAVFVSKANERLTERSVQYMLKKYNVHPHKLRHTFCQQLVDKGVSLEIVSKLAGHKDINVTKKYAKSRMEQLEMEDAIRKTFISDTLG